MSTKMQLSHIDQFGLKDAKWRGVNFGSGNGLLPDGIKPLPESISAYLQWGSVPVMKTNFPERAQDISP